MARKAKTVVAEEQVVDQLVEVVAEEIDAEEIDAEEDMDVQPSLMTQLVTNLVTQVVEAGTVKAEKNEGVGQFIRKLIAEGLGNKAILDIVHEQYGNKNTTYACVAWYRNKMKKADSEVKKASNAEWLQNFAKANNLSEEAVQELQTTMKVA